MHALKIATTVSTLIAIMAFFHAMHGASLGYPARPALYLMGGAAVVAFLLYFPAMGY